MSVEASVVDTVAKFFFFFSLDEQLSISATQNVLAELDKRRMLGPEHRSAWVRALWKWKAKLSHIRSRSWREASPAFLVPQNLDLNTWVSFLTVADPEEIEAVLLSRILQFTDEEIAEGMDLSVGTVRYRVGRGLRRLGGLVG